jgi:hypothetical protein
LRLDVFVARSEIAAIDAALSNDEICLTAAAAGGAASRCFFISTQITRAAHLFLSALLRCSVAMTAPMAIALL